MKTSEKVLYHQVHPLKLGTDITFAFVSLYFFWRHHLLVAFILAIVPSIISSFIVIEFFDIRYIEDSKIGRYLKKNMTRTLEIVRFLGFGVMAIGAWYHIVHLIALGILIVISSWFKGYLLKFLK